MKSMEDPVVVVVVTVRVVLDVVSSRRSDDDGAVETDQSSWIAQWVADLKSSSSLADSIDTLMEAELPRTVRHFDLEWFVRADEKATTKKGFLVFFVFLLLFVLFFVFVFCVCCAFLYSGPRDRHYRKFFSTCEGYLAFQLCVNWADHPLSVTAEHRCER